MMLIYFWKVTVPYIQVYFRRKLLNLNLIDMYRKLFFDKKSASSDDAISECVDFD